METTTNQKTPLVFCGKILYRRPVDGGVDIVLSSVDIKIHISSEKDKGLLFLPEGEKRHFVVEDGKILVVYIRPRIKLLRAVGAGKEITDQFLVSLNPTYPSGFGRKKKSNGAWPRSWRIDLRASHIDWEQIKRFT